MELSLLKKAWHQFSYQCRQQLTNCDLCGSAFNKEKQNVALLCCDCVNTLPLFNLKKVQGDLLNWPAINRALPHIYFDHLVCLAPYQYPFNQWITQFKYQGRFELAALFADLLYQHLCTHFYNDAQSMDRLSYPLACSSSYSLAPDVILSVPLHCKKWQHRGYNQAHLLAKYFSQKINITYDKNGLLRQKHTSSQVGKTGAIRRKNLLNAFQIILNKTKIPAHVLLLDDVVTTGATASEISRCLKLLGVKKVTVLAICLSLPASA